MIDLIGVPKLSTITELLRQRAQNFPNALAYSFIRNTAGAVDSITYEQLDCRARSIAAMLQFHKARGKRAVLLYPPGLEFIAALFGCLYESVIAVPASPPKPRRTQPIENLLRDSGASLLLSLGAAKKQWEGKIGLPTRLLHWMATDERVDATGSEDWKDQTVASDSLAYLQYTSGSTSRPRGVMITHANIMANCADIYEFTPPDEQSAGVSWLPHFHDMGLIVGIFGPLFGGYPGILMSPGDFMGRPRLWLEAITKFRGSHSVAPNFAYDLCIDKIPQNQREGLDLSCWKYAACSAEPIRYSTMERFAAAFEPYGFRRSALCPAYGLAEATLMVTVRTRREAIRVMPVDRRSLSQAKVVEGAADTTQMVVSCGPTSKTTQVCIVDPISGLPCDPGQVGEIWVCGPGIARGYWNLPEHPAFGAHIPGKGESFLRTGDLGFLHEDELFISGRLKDLIIIDGRNLYPEDIEEVGGRSHPALRSSATVAFSVDIEGREELIVIQEVDRTHRRTNLDEVIRAINAEIVEAFSLEPHAVLLLKPGTIPRTTSGKVQRHASRDLFLQKNLQPLKEWKKIAEPARSTECRAEGVRTDSLTKWLKRKVAEAKHLDEAAVDCSQPFSYYGFGSRESAAFIAELEDHLEITLAASLFYEYPSINTLAAHLTGQPSNDTGEPAKPVMSGKEPLAIIGIGCRFPGANGPAEFWRLLSEGRDCITPASDERCRLNGFDPSLRGGFLRDIDRFDADFFYISPREAERMDPQQRLLLETVWEALEDAGQMKDQLTAARIGVFVGVSNAEYGAMLLSDRDRIDTYTVTGGALSIAANRISYTFDWRGPSVSIDTACSSSLVAVHFAAQSLWSAECEMAVAGGVNLILSSAVYEDLNKTVLAPDGRCKTFDASADGYVRSEGVGLVILKPLSRALVDGDPIYCTLIGSAANHNGRSNGLVSPALESQVSLLRQAWQNAGVSPGDVQYVEAHGTGTLIGDAVEAKALGEALGKRATDERCWIGAVKTNIGHTESAAGIAGLIKTALAIRHQKLPRSLHFQQPNETIPWEEVPLRVVSEPASWPARGKRIAGVSSFGIGGANAHVVLEEYPVIPPDQQSNAELPSHLLPLSAPSGPRGPVRPYAVLMVSSKTAEGLRAQAARFAEHLRTHVEQTLEDVCYTAGAGRTAFAERAVVVGQTRAELVEALDAVGCGDQRPGVSVGRAREDGGGKLAFVFSEQGGQWAGMGRELWRESPVFRAALEACDAAVRSETGWSMVEALTEWEAARLEAVDVVQPLLWATGVSLAAEWQALGVEPDAVVGYSLGEVTAATVAGILSVEDGARVICRLSRLVKRLGGRGAMEVVELGEAEVEQAGLEEIRPQVGRTPLYSTVTCEVEDGHLCDAAYWLKNLRQRKRFADVMERLLREGYGQFVEVSPHPVLVPEMVGVVGKQGETAGSLRREQGERRALLETLGQLAVHGRAVQWNRLYPGARRVEMPTYAWQQERYWMEQQGGAAEAREEALEEAGKDNTSHPPVEKDATSLTDVGYELAWRPRPRCDVPSDGQTEGGCWLILTDAGGVGRALANCLEARGNRCLVVEPFDECSTSDRADARRVKWEEPEEYARLVTELNTPPESLRGIVHLWGLDVPSPEADVATLRSRQRVACESTVHTLQALLQHAPGTSSRVWIVTRDAVAATGNEAMTGVWQSVLWGLARVIALEHPKLWGGVVDLRQCGESENIWAVAAALADEILDPDGEDAVAFRDSLRLVPRLVRRRLDGNPVPVHSDATYLITGGFGSLGLEAAGWLLARGARDLVLVGRRGAATPEAQRAVAALEAAGARIRTVAANVADAAAMRDLIAEIRRGPSPLRGVFHAAGMVTRTPINKLEPDAIAETLQSKVDGTWVLDQLTRGIALDFFICCSSISSVWGSRDLAAYAAANHFLDSFAYYRRASGLPALAVNWGAIEGGEVVTGARDVLARIGLTMFTPDEVFRTLDRLQGPQIAQALVARVDWPLFRLSYEARGRRPLLAELSEAVASTAEGPAAAVSIRPTLARILQEQTPGGRRELIVGHLLEEVQMQLPRCGSAIDRQRGLFEQGLDSLRATELSRRLTAMLGIPVPPTVIFSHPTVDELAEHLLGAIEAFSVGGQGGFVASSPSVAPSATPKSVRPASDDGIAIVGMGCRFPGGADDPDAFWNLLWRGVDGTCEIPQGRWNVDEYFDPEPGTAGKMYVRRGGFLRDVTGFDHGFFGISPREAAHMDPQQRLLLEVAWEALERASLNAPMLEGSRAGVFVGVSMSDYARHLSGLGETHIDPYFITGNSLNALAGRLCHILGLRGPAMAVDTGCSSSLVALHLACQALRTGDCDAALACGVNLMLCPDGMVATSQARMLAPDGRCKTFDASANGYARGEGCGVVVLKRLADALADGDRVHAVVRGSAVNHDGASSGFTVPNGTAQQAVIARALAVARLKPRQIAYVETHGTGTVLGDPIELAALASALGEGRSMEDPLLVGSVKTNIGHLESAAGIASVIKVALALSHGLIPPHLHLRRPNPHFAWDKMPVAVAVTGRSWPGNGGRHLAGVSSFGISGTNAHAVLEAPPTEANSTPERTAWERPCHVLSVSARTAAALETRIANLSAYLDTHPGLSLADLCHSAAAGRSHFEHRLALVAQSVEEVRETLAAVSRGESPAAIASGVLALQAPRPKIAFVFTGQGSQYVGMGRQLYQSQPVFRAAIDRCREALRGELPRDLLEVMFEDTGLLDQTQYAQPAVFAIEHALVELWRAWGVEPAAVLGHSVGEYVAASVAGVMMWEEALKLVAVRGRLMQASPAKDGAMVALRGSEAQVSAAVAAHGQDVWIAAVNGPDEVVISGRPGAVDEVCAALERAGVSGKALRVSHAFHSGLLDPILASFEEAAAKVSFAPPRIALVSNLTATLAGAEVTEPSYWRRQVREPVRFGAGVETLVAAKCEILIEVGPHPALMAGSERGVAREQLWVPSLRRGRDDWTTLLTSVARLYVAGVPIDWVGFDQPYACRRLELPTYPWQRERHWIDVPSARGKPSAALPAEAGAEIQEPDSSALTTVWRKAALPVHAGVEAPGSWLVIGDGRDDVAAEVSAVLRQRGHEVVGVSIGDARPGTMRLPADAGADDFRSLLACELNRTGECSGVVLLANPADEAGDQPLELLARAQMQAYGTALHLVQAFDAVQARRMPRLWMATRGVEAVGEPLSVDVRHAPLAGLVRTVACEYPALRCTRIDLPLWPTAQEVKAFAAELLGDDAEHEVALRGADRFVPRLAEDPAWLSRAHDRSQVPAFSPDASYLLTGGLGGLGRALARWMVEQGARHLIIASRNAPSPSGRETVASLEAAGARVTLARVDVADYTQVASLVESCSRSGPALRGIVHLAGVLDDGLIADQTLERFGRVMRPKAYGAWNLHLLTQHLPLDFFVMYSSLVGVIGSAGQANYAAANAFLDALAHRRRALGLPAVSLDWGPFGDAGMAAEHLRLASARDWHGPVPFSTARGASLFGRSIATNSTQVALLPGTASAWLSLHPRWDDSPLFSEFRRQGAAAAQAKDSMAFRNTLIAASADERGRRIGESVQAEIARSLGMDISCLDPQRPLSDYGLDSLAGMEIKNRLERTLAVRIPIKVLLQGGTAEDLSLHVLDAFVTEHLLDTLRAGHESNVGGAEWETVKL